MKNALIVLLIGIAFIFSGCEYYELKDLPARLGNTNTSELTQK